MRPRGRACVVLTEIGLPVSCPNDRFVALQLASWFRPFLAVPARRSMSPVPMDVPNRDREEGESHLHEFRHPRQAATALSGKPSPPLQASIRDPRQDLAIPQAPLCHLFEFAI